MSRAFTFASIVACIGINALVVYIVLSYLPDARRGVWLKPRPHDGSVAAATSVRQMLERARGDVLRFR